MDEVVQAGNDVTSRSRRAKRLQRQLACMLALIPVFAAIYFLAFWLRYEGELGSPQINLFVRSLPMLLGIKCAVFAWFRVYQAWSRHVTFHDLVALAQATLGSSLLIVLGDYLLFPKDVIPRSVCLMDWGATLVGVGGLRGTWRMMQEGKWQFFVSGDQRPVMIVGAENSGEALLRALRLNDSLPYRVVGFIAGNEGQLASYISGVPVLGTLEQTCEVAERHGIAEVLIAAGDLSGRQARKLVEDCRRSRVNVRVLPSYQELINGTLATQPRPVSIEDLLRRDPVQLETSEIREWIDDRTVMVTGSAGSIGSEICRQLLRFSPRRLVLIDRSENGQFFMGRELECLLTTTEIEICIADISDEPRMRRLFMRFRPDVVFHAAAYKHVPLMEANPGEAIKNTTLATQRLADLAHEFGIESFVMISTDKAVNPTSVMGAAKRVAELYVQSLADRSNCRFVTVRFGNVLDSAGSVVPIFREQIARGGPVTVTDPRMERFFMTIPEAAQLVIQAGTMGRGGEIFILDMGEPVRIVDLAADVIRLSGLTLGEDIEIQFVGLRPGEKLFEELHVEGETHLPTRHSKIMVAERMPYDAMTIRTAIDHLAEVADQSVDAIAAELRRILPEYRPHPDSGSPPRRAAA